MSLTAPKPESTGRYINLSDEGCVVIILQPDGDFEILYPNTHPSEVPFEHPIAQATIISIFLAEPSMALIRKLIWARYGQEHRVTAKDLN